MKKLNLGFVQDLALMGTGAGAAYLYDELMADAVVKVTMQDNELSVSDVVLQMLVGWGPFVAASALGGTTSAFWSSFAGAVAFNRIDALAVTLFGQAAQSPVGPVQRGETLDKAARRLGLPWLLTPPSTS